MASSVRSSTTLEPSSVAGEAGARARAAAKALSAIIFAGLVAIVPLSSAPYGSVEPVWAAVFEAAIFLLAALWAVEGALSGGWLSRSHVLAAPGLALAAYALLQSVPAGSVGPISFDPYETRLVALELLAYTAFLALALRYVNSNRRLRALLYAVVIAGLASALFGVARQAGQRGQEGFLLEYLRPGAGYAQFINKNHFAYLAEMALGALLGIVAGGGVSRAKALVPLSLALPVWAALVLSNSRGGLFAMLCQIIFLGAAFGVTRAAAATESGGRERFARGPSLVERVSRSKAARAAFVAALLATVIVGVAWLGGDEVADRVASVGEEAASHATEPTRTGRKDIWAATWEMFEEHPLAGVGFGGYWVAVSRYHKGSGESVPQQAHSDYLETLASGGVIGAGVVTLFLFLLVRQSAPLLRAGGAFERAARLGALTGLCGVCVHSLVEFGLHVPSNAFAALALAAVAACPLVENSQKTSPNEY
jgi:O-antigen ligase